MLNIKRSQYLYQDLLHWLAIDNHAPPTTNNEAFMQLGTIDFVIMGLFFLVSLGIGLSVSKKSGKNYESFFLGSRDMPWWLLGISMVATTFSADTPNLVTDLVRSGGVAGNWVWWAFLLTGMMTVFLFAKLWRRSQVLTDVEFYELRYSGKSAAFLRGFRAVYLGLLFNVVIMATVILAATKFGGVVFGWSPLMTIFVAISVTTFYSAVGGLRGVVLTDLIQFAIAMVGAVWAAIYILNLPEVGGLSSMLEKITVMEQDSGQRYLGFLPNFAEMSWEDLAPLFFIPLVIQWWAAYYPGAEPGGGGYIAQRMFAAKSEKDAVSATMLFNIAHYALRPWPWIIVGLASLVVFPDLASISEAFPHIEQRIVKNDLAYPAMLTYLPAGLLGLVVTSIAAAFMSTMSTQVNWGASILVHDVYRRFINPEASDKQLVWSGRLNTVFLMILACILALWLESALDSFELILQIGAGTGLLFILRWFWWRINAAAEITAMIVSFIMAVALRAEMFSGLETWESFTVIVAVTTAAWILAALFSNPTDKDTLRSFYTKIHPGGKGWDKVRADAAAEGLDLPAPDSDLGASIKAMFCGIFLVYGALFATGYILYGDMLSGGIWLVVSVISLLGLRSLWSKLRFN